MDSSALLEETNELEMENPREGQEELNLNDLNSFLNSIMNNLKFPSMTHCIVSNDLECHRIQRSIVINVIQKIFYTKS